jgi:tRNA pseudouridine13 synthase
MTENGIASFFGEQRFGGLRNITHRVGEHIVKGEYEQAVMLYLTETFLEEQEEVKAVRNELAHSRDFAKALKAFPLECGFERAMTSHLHTHPNDWIGAIQAIPKQMRFLFTHALQSWLFNEVIAERMKQGIGLHKTEGDILEEGIPTAPLFGFASEFAAGIPGNIEQQVLERQGLSLSSFKIKDIPELSSKGARKQIMAFPIEPELIKIEDDAFFIGMKATTIRFRLKKGLYATTVTREIIK